MSGPVANNIFRSSGVIAAAAGGLSWQPVVTASTLSASAGNGYWINTTSNACTITLPSSATAGDQIIFVDYARTWGTNAIIIDSNGLNFQGEDDTFTVDYDTSGQAVNLVYSGATIGCTPSSDIVNALEPVAPRTQKGIFGFGSAGGKLGVTNLMNSSGVIAADTSAVGTARNALAAANYGGDKAIFAYGNDGSISNTSNLVNSSGVVASDTSGVGTTRTDLAAAGYGGDKALFAYGAAPSSSVTNVSNLVSSSGVVSADVTGVGTARRYLAAAGYGVGLAIFGYGRTAGGTTEHLSMTNLVNSSGVIGSDVTGVGTARNALAAVSYGEDKALFGFGNGGPGSTAEVSMTNLVSNVGVVGSDVTGVGTGRKGLAAASYGGDKGAFSYGDSGPGVTNIKNLVSNSGVVASDVTGAGGTARVYTAGAGYSFSA